ncbi:MAG: hypothetical protein HY057_14385 [Rhodospirillales bacterium]|nr:hypothetical protein [Rhodospirillales bacterium]
MILRRILHFISGYLRVRVIEAEGAIDRDARLPLFERYFICRLPGGGAAYLHHYLRSDPDRGPHDHPWNWAVAVPLAGGYVEERLAGFNRQGTRLRCRRRRVFLPYRLTGADFHRVICPDNTNWSLFVHGPRRKGWGFVHHVAASLDGPVFVFRPFVGTEPAEKWWRAAPRGRDIERALP